MRTSLLVAAGLIVGLAAWLLVGSVVPAAAGSSVENGTFYYRQVRGKRGRKYVRHFLLGKSLTGDKKSVYDTYGYTPHRLRVNHAGRITERWQYLEEGREFTFDAESRLIESRTILVEDRGIN